MTSFNKTNSTNIAEKNKAIHKHLHIQFEGIIIKLSQEIEEISTNIQALRKELDKLIRDLYSACDQFGLSTAACTKAIEHFCNESRQAIEAYKKAPQGYSTLKKNGIAPETMDNILERFSVSISSLIKYTKEYNKLSSEIPELPPKFLLFGIKAKLVFSKERIATLSDNNEEDEYSIKQNPANTP